MPADSRREGTREFVLEFAVTLFQEVQVRNDGQKQEGFTYFGDVPCRVSYHSLFPN